MAGDGINMKTKLIFTVGSAVLLAGTCLASLAAAQDDDSQTQPRWRARTTARQYPDDEQRVRTTSATDDVPANPPLNLPIQIDSPSNQPKPAKAKAAKDAADANMGSENEPIPAPRGTRNHGAPPSRYDPAYDEPRPARQQNEVFGDDGPCCDDDGDFGACFPGLRCMAHEHLWFRGEALLWWTKGGQTPPLLTTSPASTPLAQAGVLGQPGTSVIFGDQEMNQGLHGGARITFGTWFGCCQEYGVEFSYIILGENTQSFSDSSMGNPILARPFFNTTTGAEDSHIIAYPNVASGTFNATSTENLDGADVLFRRALVHGCDGRVDLLLGYRFVRLTDGLEIADSATSSGTGTIAPAGTTINTVDVFHTRNDFNGGDLGFATEWRRGRWGMETLLKLGIGSTHSEVVINGATSVTANGSSTVSNGGLLALPSNIGTHDSNQFSVMPELGLTLTCDVSEHLRARVGYTLLYWSNVARPGDQIDLNVDTNQFPPPIATGEKPAFVLHTSDFWAQGVNVGLDYRF
jgi:hypothetical protein